MSGQSNHGTYTVRLPLIDSSDATFIGPKFFNQSEAAGSEIQFRYINCHGCQLCEDLNVTDEVMSVQKEVEQHVINQSIIIDVSNLKHT